MNKTCEIVRDLLPLYVDDVCSGSSRDMIAAHLAGCPECSALLKKMQDPNIEVQLEQEKVDVIRRQRTFFKRKSALAGLIIAAIFMIPILVCLIVNLASGKTLDWFFIVFSALLLAASLIVVPLMVPKNKGLWTLGLGTATLLLLFGICCIYTRGDWFFIASTATLFGLALFFLPFVLRSKPVRSHLGNQKALIYFGTVTVLFVLMMLCIGLHVAEPGYWQIAAAVALPCLLYAWAMFALIRYPKYNGWIKAGTCCILTGAAFFAANSVIGYLLGYRLPWPAFHPLVWNYTTIDMNVRWLCLLSGCLLGIIFIIIGIARRGKTK